MNEKLYEIISRILSIPIEEINEESGPENIESWDSFNGLILVDELENHFKVKFTISEITEVKTVADIRQHLKNHNVIINE